MPGRELLGQLEYVEQLATTGCAVRQAANEHWLKVETGCVHHSLNGVQ